MHSRIYQITSYKFDYNAWIDLDEIKEGAMAWIDYTYKLTEEQRKEAIKEFADLFPKDMFTIDLEEETIVYNGHGFDEWLAKYAEKIKEIAENVEPNHVGQWFVGAASKLQNYILNPLQTAKLFIDNDNYYAEQSRGLICQLNDLVLFGDKLYFGTICGYHF